MGRIIAIGDVHGCYQELEDLLHLLRLGKDDRIVFLGDLVNNGPDSHRVVQIARDLNAIALLGNHERRLLRFRRDSQKTKLKSCDHRTLSELTSKDWEYLESMQLTWYHESTETVLVHGGFLPDQPWQTQSAEIVTEIQVIDEAGQAQRRAKSSGSPKWALLWKGPPFVVYGHTPERDPCRFRWSIGIDTSCVYGGKLTAFDLFTREITQVPARRKYV